MKKHNSKKVVETTEINKKVYQIVDSKKEIKTLSTKAIKAMLYSIVILLTFSAVNTSVSASETEEKVDTEVERCAAIYFTETPENKVLEEFGTIEEYEHLLKVYPMWNDIGDQILKFDLDFSNPKFSMNDNKNWVLNNNQKPKIKFNFDNESYDFTIKFAQNNNPNFANKLSANTFSYTYDLPEKFVKSEVYKREENVHRIRGYFQWKIRDCFDQQANIMQYTLKNGKLEMVFQTVGTPDAPRLSIPNFSTKDNVNKKTVLSEEQLQDVKDRELEAKMVEKQLKKKSKAKKEKARLEKRNTYIKASLLVIASSAVTATIILSTKKNKK